MKTSDRRRLAAAAKTPPRALLWIILASALSGPSHPTPAMLCPRGHRVAGLELSIGTLHVVTAAFRCEK